MRIYITNLNGHAAQSTAQICQNTVCDLAHELGYRELGIYSYPMQTDTPAELDKRLDGIIAGLRPDDVVIFQTPTWNTTAFDDKLMQKLRAYQARVILFIHDVVPLMFQGNEYLMEQTIHYYNQAEVLIAPSQVMIDTLVQHGLTVSKTLVQGMWDHPTQAPLLPARFQKVLHFPGSPERFQFVTTWDYSVPLKVYTRQAFSHGDQVTALAYRPDEQLLIELSQGGFGLVWMDDHDKGYQGLYCPYKLGTFLAAGIPVVVQRGLANLEWIEKNGLGLVVDTLEEACSAIEALTEADYLALVQRVRRFNPLLRQGLLTKRLLTEAVCKALCD